MKQSLGGDKSKGKDEMSKRSAANGDNPDCLVRIQSALQEAIEYVQHLRCCRLCAEGDECLDYAEKIREWEALLPNATGQGRGLSAYPAPDCSVSDGVTDEP